MPTRPIVRLNRRQKIAAMASVSALGALSALGGTYAAFTANDSAAPQVISSGTVIVDLAGGTFTTPIANTSPGDVIERTIQLKNIGTVGFSGVTLGQTNAGSLLTSNVLGYSVKVWDAKATPADPSDDTQVLAETKFSVFGATKLPLTLTAAQMAAGGSTNLRFVYTFDAAAPNAYQGLSDTVTFRVDAIQRAAGTFVETSPNGSVTG